MRIDIGNIIVGVGAGVVDEVLEWQDEKAGRTEPLKTWTDWGRIGLCAIGYLGQALNFFPRITAPLAQSEVTLATKSVSAIIRQKVGTTAAMVSRPRSPASPSPSGRVGRSYQPEFETVAPYAF